MNLSPDVGLAAVRFVWRHFRWVAFAISMSTLLPMVQSESTATSQLSLRDDALTWLGFQVIFEFWINEF